MAGGGEALPAPLEFTPTWIMAALASVLILMSLAAERGLQLLGKTLKKRNPKTLYEALLKVKEELMLLGFIPLLLAGFQAQIQKICIPVRWRYHMLPCRRPIEESGKVGEFAYCQRKGKVPLLSLEAMQQLDNFLFVLAITHIIFSVSIMLLGGTKIRQWRQWEVCWHKDFLRQSSNQQIMSYKVDTQRMHATGRIKQSGFIQKRFKGIGIESRILCWLHCFGKQFYGSLSKSDYDTMRSGFIMRHCPGNQMHDFHKYIMRSLEADFKELVGIRWHLWVFMVMFLLLNVSGWHVYFWIAFLPLILVLVIGTKLEHIISQLAHDVAERHTAIEGDLIVSSSPSDDLFWFGKPRIVLHLIHFIFFQNAFEIAFFFWVLTTYGYDSCMMGPVGFIVPRLVIGVVIQLLCSYSTLPLYAIVTQMGSRYKKELFSKNVQQGLLRWVHKVKTRRAILARPSDTLEMTRQAVAYEDAVGNGEIERVPAS